MSEIAPGQIFVSERDYQSRIKVIEVREGGKIRGKSIPCDKRRSFKEESIEDDSKPHPCPSCPKRYAHPSCVKRHIKEKHKIPAETFECTYCGRTFTREYQHTHHVMYIHRNRNTL